MPLDGRWKAKLSISINITAAVIARFWMAGLQFVLTPILLALLGPDSYGLIGFGIAVSVFLMFLDQGMSPVFTREMAPRTQVGDREYIRNLLRSFEVSCAIVAISIGGAMFLGAQSIARFGVGASSSLTEAEIVSSIRMIGLWIAAQWPAQLYGAGLIGLQRQDLLMAIKVVGSSSGAIGGILIVWLVSPLPSVFLAWQVIVSICMSLALGAALWRMLPGLGHNPRIDLVALRSVWRFATGSLLIGLSAVLLTQLPTLVVAKYTSLADLAAYTLALTLGLNLATILTQPIAGTLMPRFVVSLKADNEVELAREYHRWTEILAALILPVVATLVWFPRPLLNLWLGACSPLVEPIAALLPWVAIGTMLNTFATMPYVLQIASGWTRLSVTKNYVAVIVLAPLLLFLVQRYGALGAAICWVMLNLGYYLIEVPLTHRRLLKGELTRWWWRGTLAPTVVVSGIYCVVTSMFIPTAAPLWLEVVIAGVTAGAAIGSLLCVLPLFRKDAFVMLRKLRLLRN